MIVVQDSSGNITTNVEKVTTIVINDSSTINTQREGSSVVATPERYTVVVENITANNVVSGQVGPPGKDGIAEEDIVYSKRIDFVGENTIYRGEAPVGSLETAPVWRIRLVTIAGDNDVSEQWAEGTAQFDKVWVSRLAYNYS